MPPFQLAPSKLARTEMDLPDSHRRARCARRTTTLALVALAAGVSCNSRDVPKLEPTSRCPIQLKDVTDETGIAFVHTDGHAGKRYIMETITAGLALLDYDGDGLTDIYFLNGAPLQGTPVDTPPSNALYRNQGEWRFTDVTAEAGIGDQGFGLGVAVADYDNDGDLDIYVNNFGPNVLYRNEGDGTFSDVTQEAGVGAGNTMGAGASFLDIDGDGLLDLYVANYVDFTYDTHVTHPRTGFVEYAGPRDYHGVPDRLFRNNGDGTFSDFSQESGISRSIGTGMGIVSADYDNDRDTDIFVLNDVSGNFLFANDGSGHFEERGLLSGAAYNIYGDALGSMGIDCGDYNNDGLLDFLMTSYQAEWPVLYRNLGNGCLEDVTLATGVGEGSLPHVNWGVGFADFDNDQDRDVFIACGHLQDQIEQYDDTTAFRVRNIVMMNTGDDKFVNVSDRCGDGLLPKHSSRGTAFDDLDNDGDIDAVVLNSRSRPTILRNDLPARNHGILIQLRGVGSNRDGVGSHVEVVAGGLSQVAEVHSGRGYQSHYGLRLHFGVGESERIDQIIVRWLGGGQDVLTNVDVDQWIAIIEGSTEVEKVGMAR